MEPVYIVRGVTMRMLAERCGVATSTISRVFSGKRSPGDALREKICRFIAEATGEEFPIENLYRAIESRKNATAQG